MSYNVDEYNTSNDTQIKFDSDTGDWSFSNNRFVNFTINGIKRCIQWYAWKFILLGIFVLIIGYVGKGQVDAYKAADEMSDHAASDGWFKAFDQFKKTTDFKQTTVDSHPLYNSPIIKEWEQETKLKFADLYQYIVIKNQETGEKEDLLVMNKPAFDIEDTEKMPLKLDLSTMAVDDAEDICEEFFGDVPNNYQKTFYDRKRHWNIKKIKNELTQENDDDENYFRCVIDQETITELMED